MAQGFLKVSTTDMQAAAGKLNSYVQDMTESFQTMKQTMASTSHYWVGEAGEAHRAMYEEQVANTEDFIARCNEHIRDLYAMAGVYYEAEQTAQTKAEELPVSLL